MLILVKVYVVTGRRNIDLKEKGILYVKVIYFVQVIINTIHVSISSMCAGNNYHTTFSLWEGIRSPPNQETNE